MGRAVRGVAILLVAFGVAAPALAQFGHPLKGTFSGAWGPSRDKQAHVVL